MERIAVKFGGSSVADAGQISKVRQIIEADPRRTVIVVSAPGKRFAEESKLTDLLYLCHDIATIPAMAGKSGALDEPFGLIYRRFAEIAHALELSDGVLSELDNFREQLTQGCSRDFVASRGEYFSARLIAEYLEADFIDPADFIVVRPNNSIDPVSYERLSERMADTARRYVIAGFYGCDHNGEVKTFSRGGSDISGAIAARAAGAILYENWTDTSGILMADPRIVPSPRPITEITFREIREMAYMGASVFHDDAIQPVREVAIPIRICNTNRPEDPGTVITASLTEQAIASTEIAGIAGRKDFSMISMEKSMMNKEVGFVHRLLGILREHNISFEHCPSSIDSVSVIIEDSQLNGLDAQIIEQIQKRLEPDTLTIERGLALVAVVGEGMVRTVGIAGKIFTAMSEAGINVRIINQGASEMNIIVGIATEDYEKAVRTIYNAFVVGQAG